MKERGRNNEYDQLGWINRVVLYCLAAYIDSTQ